MLNKKSKEKERGDTHLKFKMCLVQEVHVEDVRVLVDGSEKDLHLHQVHDHPVSREDVSHEVLKHDERLHEEVLRAAEDSNLYHTLLV